MNTPAERQQALSEILDQRILVIDGAMGTMLQQRELTAADFGGPALEGCNEALTRTRPDVVLGIHRAYLNAGADAIETNTFNCDRISLGDYGLQNDVHALNVAAARLARQAADELATAARPRFVAGAMGPTNKSITVVGGVTFPQLVEVYYERAKGLVEGGVDILVLETCNDTLGVKAGLAALERVRNELGWKIPIIVSATIESSGTMLAGQAADALCASIAHADLLAVGLNCGTGPEFMTDHIRTISAMIPARVSCYPNAGMPDAEGKYGETPASIAAQLGRFIENGWLNIVGGCCGTTDAHIAAIARMAEGKRPRPLPERSHRTYYSGIDLVEADESNRPLVVGERTNVIGSRLFKSLVAAEKWEEASEIARHQVRNGAQIVDVCLQSADRDELLDAPPFYERLNRKIKAPVMIDTTDPRAVELALTWRQGKSIVNSVNLEDGEEKFERVCPLAKRYGAALVVGAIDEDKRQAQAFTRERKLAVALRSYKLLTEKYGIPPEDIIIDPLVFPCASGDVNYIGAAVETIEGVRLVKENLPFAKTVLGISNVSFGLPAAAREVVNSVFLYYCTKAGLDLAIVNAEKLERFASIPEEERRLAESLLFNTPPADAEDENLRAAPEDWRQQEPDQRAAINQFHIAAVAQHFRGAGARVKARPEDLPLDARLANYIIEGSKDGLIPDLDRKRSEGAAPLEIINGPLMAGMNEVGRLFNNNELIVAEVLQSAEAMKTAVSHLEQFMEKSESAARGAVILATVKGDVHDIGKNLVDIILSNNGYRVINLGIKVPPEALIQAYHEHAPDLIGLSGLLVKSTQQMAITAGDLKAAGISVPLLVGGAALSEKFARTRIGPAYGHAVCYAKDAMTGLSLANRLMDPAEREALVEAHTFAEPSGADLPVCLTPESARPSAVPLPPQRSAKVRTDIPIPPAPYLERKARAVPHLAEVWSYINPYMLYGRHLGYKGNFEKALAEREPKALEMYHNVEALKREAAAFMQVKAVWRFFEAERDGNAIHLFAPGGASPIHTFRFGRQNRENGLCLSDYILDPEDGRRDHLALFVVTAGASIRDQAEEWKQAGEFFKAHAIQAVAIETAEGAAEWLHRRIREDWGFPDPPTLTMHDRFTSKYRGKRYSFGYPACPNLDDQQGLFALLGPEDIGVQLTEGMMMDPEASVSALVFHHPDCVYFSAGEA
ncbi:MAG: methionine synthase [Bryobacteraceae bacterium]|jgi:5-methyltetrahydrofolate--homocysteine methyltransferase